MLSTPARTEAQSLERKGFHWRYSIFELSSPAACRRIRGAENEIGERAGRRPELGACDEEPQAASHLDTDTLLAVHGFARHKVLGDDHILVLSASNKNTRVDLMWLHDHLGGT